MNFRRITEHQRTLRARATKLAKEAGVVGSTLGLAGKAIAAPAKAVGGAMYRSSKRLGGPVIGPLMFGAGVLGLGGAAAHGINKAKEYNRGFDPRIQDLKLQGQRV